MDWIDLAKDRYMLVPCECGIEPSDFIKCGEFVD
jgi:hypothetical protein